MRKILLCFLFLLICPILPAQQTLDNDGVIKLKQARLTDDLIISNIDAHPGKYDISNYALDLLRRAGISEKVLAAIVHKESGAPLNTFPGLRPNANTGTGAAGAATPVSPAAPPSPATGAGANTTPATGSDTTSGSARSRDTPAPTVFAPTTGPNGLPVGIDDVGVYYRDQNGAWVQMFPEVVNFQSAVKIQDFATAGIFKSDLNGKIEGPHSRVVVTLPLVFAVYLPQTLDISDYILLELHPTSNARIFLSAEGGLLHTKPGAHQDQIDFQPEKLAPRLYQITLPAIEGKGEYGLLAPGTKFTSNKEAIGKIYTVSVAE